MICVDGGQGLLAALPNVYGRVPIQRCWAHKIRNVLNKVRAADQEAVKRRFREVRRRTRPWACSRTAPPWT